MDDAYLTIEGPATGTFKDRGSRFVAYAFPVFTETEWQQHLQQVRQDHFKARHHCYAFRLGTDQNQFRANDDGEPSGTAGRPILGQIDHLGLTNIIVIVVRYFGGTKLGTSGLINAYREAARAALEEATIVEKILKEVYELSFDYHLMSQVMNAVKKWKVEIVQQDFSERGTLHIAIRKSEVAPTLLHLTAAIANIHPEEAAQLKQTEGFGFRHLYSE